MTPLTTTRAHAWAAVPDTRAWLSRRLTLALAALALLGGGIAAPAARAQAGNTVIRAFSGVPSGACSNIQIAVNLLNGDLYDCLAGGWHLVSGAGGAGTFDLIGSGVNTSATMTLGTGGTLTFSGSGINNASAIRGVSITGTPGAGQIPISTSSTAAAWGDPIIQGTQAAGSTTIPNPLVSGGSDYGGTPAIRTWKVDSAGSGHLTIDNASAIMGNCGATTVNAYQYCGNNTAANGVAPGFVTIPPQAIQPGTSSNAYTYTGDFIVGKIDSRRVVDGVRFSTIAAAQADCGSVNPCIVEVPSTYAGANAAASFNITMLDFTGGIPAGGNEGIEFNSTTASNLQSRLRVSQNPLSPTGTTVGVFGLNIVQGAIPSAQSQIGMAGEVDTAGTVTTSAQGTLVGVEGTIGVNSTGGSLPDVRAFTANMFGTAGNSTPVSQMVGFYAQAATNAGSGAITNAYGIVAENQTVGASGNLSIWAKGATQTDGKALFDCSTVGTRCVVISGDPFSNNNELELVDTHAGGHTWDIGEMMALTHLSFRNLSVGSGPAWSMAFTGTAAVEGVLSHANSVNRTYSFPDAAITVAGINLAQIWSAAQSYNAGTLLPTAAGGTDLGSTALPFGNLWLGTAATNNFKFQPAATAAARVISMPDPLGAVNMPYVIVSGTSAMTTAAVAGGACGTTVTTAATGALTTDSIEIARNAAATAANGGLLALNWWVTAGNVNFNYCNGGTVSNTPTAMTINWRVIR